MDRALQFKRRLKWDVKVDIDGQEYDCYDDLNPIYIVVENECGEHAGSMRILPTTGRTMVNDHFLHLTDGVAISSPFIWECTRLCLSATANRAVAPTLLAAAATLMEEFEVAHFVGVFDARMKKIYQRLGASPTILGASDNSCEAISVGLWEFDYAAFEELCRKAQIEPKMIRSCFDCSQLGTPHSESLMRKETNDAPYHRHTA